MGQLRNMALVLVPALHSLNRIYHFFLFVAYLPVYMIAKHGVVR